MSERDTTEGNTNAPRVQENEVRPDDSAHSGPRRVKEVRAERDTQRDSHTDYGSGYSSPEQERATSWISVILGWLTALGAGLILSGILSAIVGAIFGSAGRQGTTEGGTTAFIGLLITLAIGLRYRRICRAGRMASRQGLKHGLVVPP